MDPPLYVLKSPYGIAHLFQPCLLQTSNWFGFVQQHIYLPEETPEAYHDSSALVDFVQLLPDIKPDIWRHMAHIFHVVPSHEELLVALYRSFGHDAYFYWIHCYSFFRGKEQKMFNLDELYVEYVRILPINAKSKQEIDQIGYQPMIQIPPISPTLVPFYRYVYQTKNFSLIHILKNKQVTDITVMTQAVNWLAKHKPTRLRKLNSLMKTSRVSISELVLSMFHGYLDTEYEKRIQIPDVVYAPMNDFEWPIVKRWLRTYTMTKTAVFDGMLYFIGIQEQLPQSTLLHMIFNTRRLFAQMLTYFPSIEKTLQISQAQSEELRLLRGNRVLWQVQEQLQREWKLYPTLGHCPMPSVLPDLRAAPFREELSRICRWFGWGMTGRMWQYHKISMFHYFSKASVNGKLYNELDKFS